MSLGQGLPKCLLRIGARSLIEYSLDNLVASGIDDITIVTGYCDALIQRRIGDCHKGVSIDYRFNRHYAETGSVVSLPFGLPGYETSSLIVVESDILYHPAFIEKAMSAPDNTIMVADVTGSGDEVFVSATSDGKLDYLGKSASASQRQKSLGEFAGITRLSGDFCREFAKRSERLMAEGKADGHYEELIFDMSREGHDVQVLHCASKPWTEVDTPADFNRAKHQVYPALRHIWSEDVGATTAPNPQSASLGVR